MLAVALISYFQSRQAVGPIVAAKPSLSATLPPGEVHSSINAPTGNPTDTPGNGAGGTTQISAITSPTPPPASPSPPHAIPSSQNRCGAPPNPWGYNFCKGSHFHNAPSDFCSYFICSSTFWTKPDGYVEECVDGQFSHSGAQGRGCEGHLGSGRALLAPEAS